MATELRAGNLAIGLVILAFMIGGLTFVFNDFETQLGVSGVASDLNAIDSGSNLSSNTRGMASDLSSQVDDAEDLAVSSDIQIEDRGSSISGVLNLFSKNIVSRFFKEVSATFNIPSYVLVLLVSLLTVIVTILTVRLFFGRDRV